MKKEGCSDLETSRNKSCTKGGDVPHDINNFSKWKNFIKKYERRTKIGFGIIISLNFMIPSRIHDISRNLIQLYSYNGTLIQKYS
jgi:hypothetical protein